MWVQIVFGANIRIYVSSVFQIPKGPLVFKMSWLCKTKNLKPFLTLTVAICWKTVMDHSFEQKGEFVWNFIPVPLLPLLVCSYFHFQKINACQEFNWIQPKITLISVCTGRYAFFGNLVEPIHTNLTFMNKVLSLEVAMRLFRIWGQV